MRRAPSTKATTTRTSPRPPSTRMLSRPTLVIPASRITPSSRQFARLLQVSRRPSQEAPHPELLRPSLPSPCHRLRSRRCDVLSTLPGLHRLRHLLPRKARRHNHHRSLLLAKTMTRTTTRATRVISRRPRSRRRRTSPQHPASPRPIAGHRRQHHAAAARGNRSTWAGRA